MKTEYLLSESIDKIDITSELLYLIDPKCLIQSAFGNHYICGIEFVAAYVIEQCGIAEWSECVNLEVGILLTTLMSADDGLGHYEVLVVLTVYHN